MARLLLSTTLIAVLFLCGSPTGTNAFSLASNTNTNTNVNNERSSQLLRPAVPPAASASAPAPPVSTSSRLWSSISDGSDNSAAEEMYEDDGAPSDTGDDLYDIDNDESASATTTVVPDDDKDSTSTSTKFKGLNWELLHALNDNNDAVMFGGTGFGGGTTATSTTSSNDKMDRIRQLAADLEGTYILPLPKPESSRWKLLYTDAPDVLGFQGGGPVSQLVGMEQETTASQWTFRFTYQPSSPLIMGLTDAFSFLPADLGSDRLEQTVVWTCDMESNNRANLKLKETTLQSSRVSLELPALPFVGAQLLPPVGVEIVFQDGDLRMDRTVQGDFLFIYQRM